MKESHKVRPSQSPWSRVMRRVGGYPTLRVRRVEADHAAHGARRGTTRLCIELRKHLFVVADLILTRGRQ